MVKEGVKDKRQRCFTTNMRLTDLQIKRIQPPLRGVLKRSDGNGLLLLVYPNGSKYWSFKYRWLGKQKSLSLGVYPDVTLAMAREANQQARRLVAQSIDPSEHRKAAKRQAQIAATNSFESVAREWLDNQQAKWTPRYAANMRSRLEDNIFPALGRRPIAEITAPELLAVIRVIEKRGAFEMAHRALQTCGQVFMFGIATCRAERNIAADLRTALKTRPKKHFAHLKEEELPEFLAKIENDTGDLQTGLALKLMLLTGVRTKEIRGAKWSEIDFEKAEWRISAARMKKRREHIVPLSRQAIIILREQKRLSGRWEYVFPHQFKPIKQMSENTMLHVIYRAGYKGRMTGHGVRHTASTILHERGFDSNHIELQLSHVDKNTVRRTYNHALYLPQRREMMQWWADYLVEAGLKIEPSLQIITNKRSTI